MSDLILYETVVLFQPCKKVLNLTYIRVISIVNANKGWKFTPCLMHGFVFPTLIQAGLIFHSDQGSQYTSKAFASLLKVNGVTQSLSMPGQPLDNAVAESFFSAFKKEEAYRKDYVSERHFIESVTKYIDFYNNARPHKTNRYKTPTEYE